MPSAFYRRILSSPPAIDFVSSEGKKLFVEASQSGTVESFYKLVFNFQTQSEPNYCGLASLSMVLNTLAIDPGRKWKGPWRWFDESMLDYRESIRKVKARGISFGKLVCLAHCAGAKVEAFHASHSNLDDFRKYVMKSSMSDECQVISSYHRAALQQTGTGHFSPIGGYHVGKDMALILDVARYKYPPHWVPLTLLWEGMSYVDETTGKSRGYMLISRPHREASLLYTLSCKHESWNSIAKFLMDDVPLLIKSEDVKDVHNLLSVVVSSLPPNFEEFIKLFSEEEVLKQVQETALFKHVASFMSHSCGGNSPTSGNGDTLPDIAASVGCQGAEILSGKLSSSAVNCCQETCFSLKSEDEKPLTMVCGTLLNGNTEQGVDVLVPSSPRKLCCNCSCPSKNISMHPAGPYVLTVLLLSLPSTTWDGIKDEELLREMYALVSIENLPALLQEEVLHLRHRLHLLKSCQEGTVDEDLGAPLS